jgi:membrane associated rhomboid family serine protease
VTREPIFNIPTVIVTLVGALALIHFARDVVLTDQQDIELILTFAFIPARYDSATILGGTLPGGFGAEIWSFFTYAFLHADWTHFAVNAVWLLPFGSAVARRFGASRFLLFFAVTAAAGAMAQLAAHAGQQFTMIGASAAISGMMAAAMRFAFQRGGPLGLLRGGDIEAYRVPALPLSGVLSDPRVLGFLAVWFGINLLFGAGPLSIEGAGQPVAWQAHIGGFFAGLFLFGFFDPVNSNVPPPTEIDAPRH